MVKDNIQPRNGTDETSGDLYNSINPHCVHRSIACANSLGDACCTQPRRPACRKLAADCLTLNHTKFLGCSSHTTTVLVRPSPVGSQPSCLPPPGWAHQGTHQNSPSPGDEQSWDSAGGCPSRTASNPSACSTPAGTGLVRAHHTHEPRVTQQRQYSWLREQGDGVQPRTCQEFPHHWSLPARDGPGAAGSTKHIPAEPTATTVLPCQSPRRTHQHG